jgi:uncharacterized phage protein (TIGR02218 family)
MMFKTLEIFKKNRPIEFYEIRRGNTYWRYTSGDESVTYLGNVYTPTTLKRSKIVHSGELAQDNVNLFSPVGHDLVDALTGFPVGTLVRLTVFSQHRGANDTAQLFYGRYMNFRFRGAECELRFESLVTARREQGLRRTASPGCSHTLYDTAPMSCGVVKALYKTTFAPSIVDKTLITSAALAAHPDGWFDGGLLDYTRPDGLMESRSIDTHVGSTITLRAPIPGLIAGLSVDAYPGCNHDLATDCDIKFDNAVNHGGMPFVPQENPYDGHPLF